MSFEQAGRSDMTSGPDRSSSIHAIVTLSLATSPVERQCGGQQKKQRRLPSPPPLAVPMWAGEPIPPEQCKFAVGMDIHPGTSAADVGREVVERSSFFVVLLEQLLRKAGLRTDKEGAAQIRYGPRTSTTVVLARRDDECHVPEIATAAAPPHRARRSKKAQGRCTGVDADAGHNAALSMPVVCVSVTLPEAFGHSIVPPEMKIIDFLVSDRVGSHPTLDVLLRTDVWWAHMPAPASNNCELSLAETISHSDLSALKIIFNEDENMVTWLAAEEMDAEQLSEELAWLRFLARSEVSHSPDSDISEGNPELARGHTSKRESRIEKQKAMNTAVQEASDRYFTFMRNTSHRRQTHLEAPVADVRSQHYAGAERNCPHQLNGTKEFAQSSDKAKIRCVAGCTPCTTVCEIINEDVEGEEIRDGKNVSFSLSDTEVLTDPVVLPSEAKPPVLSWGRWRTERPAVGGYEADDASENLTDPS